MVTGELFDKYKPFVYKRIYINDSSGELLIVNGFRVLGGLIRFSCEKEWDFSYMFTLKDYTYIGEL